jgi:hypothetical protein
VVLVAELVEVVVVVVAGLGKLIFLYINAHIAKLGNQII